jgi:hypothetical protein
VRANMYHRWHVTVTLEREEEFVTANEKGHEFFVRTITYSGGSKVGVSGPAKRASDGERGFVDRYYSMRFVELSEEIQKAIRTEVEGFLNPVKMGAEL